MRAARPRGARAIMDRRRKVAQDARALIEELDQIQAESERSGDAAFRLIGTFDEGHLACREMAARLAKLAEVLERRPDWAVGEGFKSRKPSWRGFLREVRAGLAALNFELRERDAVALASAICRAGGIAEPSRANVRHALRDRGDGIMRPVRGGACVDAVRFDSMPCSGGGGGDGTASAWTGGASRASGAAVVGIAERTGGAAGLG
jgi:hypothetical protein